MNASKFTVGTVFFVVTNAIAVNAVFGELTDVQLADMGERRFLLLCAKVLALAGTNVLAHLVQSNRTQPPVGSPPPGPAQ